MKSCSPLRYPGGKVKLFQFVEKLIKDNYDTPPVYIEPYSGGFGLGLKLLLTHKVSKVYINDADFAIYAFWRAITEHTDTFIDLVNTAVLSIEEWKKQKDIYLNKDSTILEKGFATFYLNRTNRSGIILAGPMGGFHQEGNYKLDCRFNKKNLVEIIRIISLRKNDIFISNLDGVEFIEYIDNKEKNALFYLDPPYVSKGKELYKNSFTETDHVNLFDKVKTLNNKWFVTYDDHNFIEKLYEEFPIYKFYINYSVQSKRKAKEIAVFHPSFRINQSGINLNKKTQ